MNHLILLKHNGLFSGIFKLWFLCFPLGQCDFRWTILRRFHFFFISSTIYVIFVRFVLLYCQRLKVVQSSLTRKGYGWSKPACHRTTQPILTNLCNFVRFHGTYIDTNVNVIIGDKIKMKRNSRKWKASTGSGWFLKKVKKTKRKDSFDVIFN